MTNTVSTEVEHGLSEASIGAAHPGLIVQLHYKCRDIGYGIEEGTVAGHFTGNRDNYGKYTFRRDDGGADLYLFEDEIYTVAPAIAAFGLRSGRREAGDRTMIGGTVRKIGPSGGGYMTAGGSWVSSYWKNPRPFTGSAGAQARRNRRRDVRKNWWTGMGNYTDAAFSPCDGRGRLY
jgi:hypothetical protein